MPAIVVESIGTMMVSIAMIAISKTHKNPRARRVALVVSILSLVWLVILYVEAFIVPSFF